MQDYYYVPSEKKVIEIGRDEWIYSPRDKKRNDNVFIFLTWEDDGSDSPDTNVYNDLSSFLQSYKISSLNEMDTGFKKNDIFFVPVCKDDWGMEYEDARGKKSQIVGFLYQSKKYLREYCFEDWEERALKEMKHYNQFLCGEVYFINVYSSDDNIEYFNSIYEKSEFLDQYFNPTMLGSFNSIDECKAAYPKLFGKKSGSVRMSDYVL